MRVGIRASRNRADLQVPIDLGVDRLNVADLGGFVDELTQALQMRYVSLWVSSEPVRVLDDARAFVAEAKAAGEPGHACIARRALGDGLVVAVKFARAADLLRRAVAEHDEVRDAALPTLYGHDVFANAQATLAQALWLLGEIERALKRGAESGEGEFTSLRLRQRAIIEAVRDAPDPESDFRAALGARRH